MNNIKLCAEDAVIVGDNIYFVSGESTILFVVSIKDKSISVIGVVPEDFIFIKQAFRRILYWNNELIFIPYNARYVHFYNINLKTWRKSKCLSEKYNESMYIEALVHNDKLIIVGADEPNILEMDLDDLSYKIVNTCFEKYKVAGELICRGGYSVVNNTLYLAIATKNVVVEINLEDWSDKEYNIGDEICGFSGITRVDDYYWISPRKKGNIIKWDGKSGLEIIKLPFELDEGVCYFGGLCADDCYIYIYGLLGKYTVKINRKNGSLDYYEKQYVFLKASSDNKIIGQVLNGTIEVLEQEGMTQVIGLIDKSALSEAYKYVDFGSVMGPNMFSQENDYYSLDDYVECIKQKS